MVLSVDVIIDKTLVVEVIIDKSVNIGGTSYDDTEVRGLIRDAQNTADGAQSAAEAAASAAGTANTNALFYHLEKALSDVDSNVTAGSKGKLKMKYDVVITNTDSIIWEFGTSPTGSTSTLDIKKNGTSIFTNKVTVDSGENTSRTAATPYSLTTNPMTLANNDELEIIIDNVGSVVAGKDSICTIKGTRT